jgi:hypothetical protein
VESFDVPYLATNKFWALFGLPILGLFQATHQIWPRDRLRRQNSQKADTAFTSSNEFESFPGSQKNPSKLIIFHFYVII